MVQRYGQIRGSMQAPNFHPTNQELAHQDGPQENPPIGRNRESAAADSSNKEDNDA